MSAGGYDAPHIPPNYSRYEPRRSSGGMSANYDRPPNAPLRRRTPSPAGPSRRLYDTYVPPRSEVPFRDPMPNVYRPNNYRPGEHSGNYYSRSPSPDAYGYPNQPRMPEPDIWERGPSRRPLPEAPNNWPERKIIPASPTSSAPARTLRDESSRLFEPSESWKQTHHDRPPRIHPSPPSDRYFDRRNRSSMDISPERPMRNDRPPAFIPGGDRYRPAPNKRESFPPGRNDYDSYRPQYDNWTPPFRREPMSPAGSHHRRDSGSAHARTSDRYDSPFSSRAVSRRTSPSPRPVISPSPSLNRTVLNAENEPWSHPPPPPRSEAPTRAPSRSSIASTHVSDRRSPPAPVVTAVVRTPSIAPDPLKQPPLPVDESKSDKTDKKANRWAADAKLVDAKFESNGVRNGLLEPAGQVSPVDGKSVPKPMSTITKNPATVEPTIPNDVPAINPSLSVTYPTKNAPKIPEIIEKGIAVTPAKSSTNGVSPATSSKTGSAISDPVSPPPAATNPPAAASPPAATDPPAATSLPAATSPPAATNVAPLPKKFHDFLEIKQPQPSYTPSLVLSPVLSPFVNPADIHIPSPTHSPILATPPPMDDVPLQPIFQQPIPRPDEIPAFSDAKTKEDALRIVVMTRLLCDRQSREERVAPVLAANLAIANPPEAHPIATPASLVEKMTTGQALEDRMQSFAFAKPLLFQYFEQRNALLEDKVTRLREEYVSLQERWIGHCNTLNEQQKTLASEHENQHGGRTTRRSTAITDAVRSDFEMEQIIASLGVDDATDPNHLSMKNVARIPDMISVTKGQVDYLFDDTSNLIDNPKEYYAPQTGIYDWTEEEKQIFLDKFAAYPKQFGIIADFIQHKTAAQCVDFYYLHKKRAIDFRKVVSLFAPNKRKRRGMGKKKGNGLLVDIAKHDMEVNRANVTASPSVSTRAPRGRRPAAVVAAAAAEAKRATTRRGAVQFEDTPTSTPTPEPEMRTRRRKAASNLTSAPPSTVTSSATPIVAPTPVSTAAPTPRSVSVTPLPPALPPPIVQDVPETPYSIMGQEQPPEQEIEARPIKRVKRTRKIKSAAIVSDDPSSPGPEGEKDLPPTGNEGTDLNARGRKEKIPPPANQWSEEDKNLFLSLLAQYGDDFKRIAASMPNKTTIQVSNFYKSNATALDLRKVAARAPKRSPTPEHHDVWKELPFPGSGVIASVTTVKTGTSASTMSSIAPPMASLSADTGRSNLHHVSAAYSRDPAAPQSASPSRPQSRNPYPTLHPPQPTVSMAHPYSDPHRPTYSPPGRSATYSYADHRGIYMTTRPPDGSANRPSGSSSPMQSRSHFAPAYLSSTSPPLPSTNRPGYVPPPAVGPNAPSIVHSPTGMTPPKPLPPVQPMQSYPAQQSDPAQSHRSPYTSYPHLSPPPGAYWGPTPRYYNPDGTTSSYVDPRHMPGPNDGVRRDHGYAMYPVGGPPVSGSHPPGWLPQPGPPTSAPGAGRQAYYYPGWTT